MPVARLSLSRVWPQSGAQYSSGHLAGCVHPRSAESPFTSPMPPSLGQAPAQAAAPWDGGHGRRHLGPWQDELPFASRANTAISPSCLGGMAACPAATNVLQTRGGLPAGCPPPRTSAGRFSSGGVGPFCFGCPRKTNSLPPDFHSCFFSPFPSFRRQRRCLSWPVTMSSTAW